MAGSREFCSWGSLSWFWPEDRNFRNQPYTWLPDYRGVISPSLFLSHTGWEKVSVTNLLSRSIFLKPPSIKSGLSHIWWKRCVWREKDLACHYRLLALDHRLTEFSLRRPPMISERPSYWITAMPPMVLTLISSSLNPSWIPVTITFSIVSCLSTYNFFSIHTFIYLHRILQFTKILTHTHIYLVAQWQRIHLPMKKMEEMLVQSLGREESLAEQTATPACILAWWIPWTGEPGGPHSMASQRVRHDWSDCAHTQSTHYSSFLQRVYSLSQFL